MAWWCDIKEIKEYVFILAKRLKDMDNKINDLVDDEERKKDIFIAEKTLDKFEDYMKNVDKLNAMVNEFKGCVSMARGALKTSKGKDTV